MYKATKSVIITGITLQMTSKSDHNTERVEQVLRIEIIFYNI